MTSNTTTNITTNTKSNKIGENIMYTTNKYDNKYKIKFMTVYFFHHNSDKWQHNTEMVNAHAWALTTLVNAHRSPHVHLPFWLMYAMVNVHATGGLTASLQTKFNFTSLGGGWLQCSSTLHSTALQSNFWSLGGVSVPLRHCVHCTGWPLVCMYMYWSW